MFQARDDAPPAGDFLPAGPSPKVGILTFHRCINYGSYWQARCLVSGLRARGLDAVLLDHECPRATRAEWRCAFQPLLPSRSPRSDFAASRRKVRRLLEAVAALPLSRRFRLDAPDTLDRYDLIVVGSDEVWNMEHPWYGSREIFYGTGLPAARIVSYAASFGSQEARWGLHPWWADKLRAFSALSVRDENSRAMVKGATGIDPELVLDPCLQFPPETGSEAADETPYVALYGHSFPAWYAERVRAWAGRRGLRLISIGYRNAWADEQRLDAGPEDFRRTIARSAAVATNFFHGCVFALLHRRPFASAGSRYRMNKVRDLLHSLDAAAHLTSEADGAERFEALLGQPLAPAIETRLAALRRSSSRFLDHALA
jgi:hypothetical protein